MRPVVVHAVQENHVKGRVVGDLNGVMRKLMPGRPGHVDAWRVGDYVIADPVHLR